jgi:hypothetical protein
MYVRTIPVFVLIGEKKRKIQIYFFLLSGGLFLQKALFGD